MFSQTLPMRKTLEGHQDSSGVGEIIFFSWKSYGLVHKVNGKKWMCRGIYVKTIREDGVIAVLCLSQLNIHRAKPLGGIKKGNDIFDFGFVNCQKQLLMTDHQEAVAASFRQWWKQPMWEKSQVRNTNHILGDINLNRDSEASKSQS